MNKTKPQVIIDYSEYQDLLFHKQLVKSRLTTLTKEVEPGNFEINIKDKYHGITYHLGNLILQNPKDHDRFINNWQVVILDRKK